MGHLSRYHGNTVPHINENSLAPHFTKSFRLSAQKIWTKLIGVLKAQARDAYPRELCLAKRIQYVHTYLLARAWYTAQVFPMPTDCARQVNSAISWYIWRSAIFHVPISTLQRRKRQGGWDLINISAKSCTVLYLRLQSQGQNTGTPTAEWLRAWKLHAPSTNPLYSQNTTTYGIPASLRTGLCLYRPTTTNGSTKRIQAPHIRHIANPTQRDARTGGDAIHAPLAQHRLDKDMEKFTGDSSNRK